MTVKVCLIQDSPVFFDKAATLDKIETLVQTYSKKGAELIVFPESFIPGYPRGFTFGTSIGSRSAEGRKLYAEYHEQSLDLNSPDLKRLEALSKKSGAYLVIGVTEKQRQNGSLYCSMLYISPSEGLLGVHRKIKPTAAERFIWADASGDSLVTFQTRIGILGGLICWENYMPLARMAMYRQGVEIYIAPTADSRESWISSMQHIALEGRCFVLACNQFFKKSMYPRRFQDQLTDSPEPFCRGGSLIVSPLGEILEGPLYDTAGALMANLDLQKIPESRMDFDPAGHYSRDDIFKFEAIGQPPLKNERTDK
jgi:nitrilase